MVFSSVIKTLSRNTLTQELNTKLKQSKALELSGISRLAKVLLSSVLAQSQEQNILIVCATLEEAGRWTAQMEVMGWQNVYFYPTSESSPYDLLNSESEMVWGQMQVLSSLNESKPRAIIATERALQPHLPPPSAFYDACITLKVGQILEIKDLQQQLTSLDYR